MYWNARAEETQRERESESEKEMNEMALLWLVYFLFLFFSYFWSHFFLFCLLFYNVHLMWSKRVVVVVQRTDQRMFYRPVLFFTVQCYSTDMTFFYSPAHNYHIIHNEWNLMVVVCRSVNQTYVYSCMEETILFFECLRLN